MAHDGFYDNNRGRGFPLLAGLTGKPTSISADCLPLSALIDFGCVMGMDSGYDESDDSVYLHSVSRTGSTIRFELRSTASGLANYALVFERDVTAAMHSIDYADAATIDESPLELACDGVSIWSGFLVTGDMEQLGDLLGEGDSLAGGEAYKFEPALVRSRVRGYARSINLANADRTRATAPEGCPSYVWPAGLQDYYEKATCLAGQIRFRRGYNCLISVNPGLNAIEFAAGVGQGDGEPCEAVPLFEDDGPPEGSSLMSGGPTCNETIRSINGIGGPHLKITVGNGVSLEPLPDQHLLTLNVNFNNSTSCIDASGPLDDCDEGP